MRNIWKVGALGAVLGAVLSVGGCNDFDSAYEKCVSEGRCAPDGGAGDAGDGGPVEPPPPCGDGGVDYPDLAGLDQDCDGVDGVADAGFFVDPSGGNDENSGSQTHPVKTLSRALQLIRDGGTGRTIVYLGTGTYNEAATVVDMPVSLHGGYTWRGNESQYWERFKDDAGTLIAGGAAAFTVRDVNVLDAGVLIEALHITSATGAVGGGASVALRVTDTSMLQFRKTILESGFGGMGRDGSPGNKGAPGTIGEAGMMGGAGNGGGGGRGSSTTCTDGTTTESSNGGMGGGGSYLVASSAGFPGSPGNAQGGRSSEPTDAGCQIASCSCEGAAGDPGQAGAVGSPGGTGDGGIGYGFLQDGLWQPNQQGTNGKPGRSGAGGGGGGGGGSCRANADKVAGSSGGGGGGSGGCGGTGGEGGGGGGASIALLVVRSTVILEADSQLISLGGGTGGHGGAGGPSGDGGSGGNGGPFTTTVVGTESTAPGRVVNTIGGQGGMGGPGGAGGAGGAGGGGGGGPSVGIWCEDAGIRFSPGSMDFSQGLGGPGGNSSDGGIGATGLRSRDVACTFTDAGTP